MMIAIARQQLNFIERADSRTEAQCAWIRQRAALVQQGIAALRRFAALKPESLAGRATTQQANEMEVRVNVVLGRLQ